MNDRGIYTVSSLTAVIHTLHKIGQVHICQCGMTKYHKGPQRTTEEHYTGPQRIGNHEKTAKLTTIWCKIALLCHFLLYTVFFCNCGSDSAFQSATEMRCFWWLGRRMKFRRPQMARSASAYWLAITERRFSTRSGSMCRLHWCLCLRTWFMLSQALLVHWLALLKVAHSILFVTAPELPGLLVMHNVSNDYDYVTSI